MGAETGLAIFILGWWMYELIDIIKAQF